MLKETVNTRRWRFVAFLVVVVVAAALAAGASSWVANRSAATASPAARHLNRQAFADRLAALGQSDLAPAPTSRFVTIHASLGRNDWALSTYRNAEGKRCLVEQHPGGARAYGCRSDGQIFGQGPCSPSGAPSRTRRQAVTPGPGTRPGLRALSSRRWSRFPSL